MQNEQQHKTNLNEFTTMSEAYETEDLKQGVVYHIKNNWAENADDLWFNNATLINIENNWAEPIILTFMLENGNEIVIDGDLVSKKSGQSKATKRYQIIAKRI